MSGILGHVRYDCPTCILCELYSARNCTGGKIRYHATGAAIDHDDPPRPIPRPQRPAYRDGWADVAVEANELGIKGFAEAFKGEDYFAPIQHCLRLYVADAAAIAWLRMYGLIRSQLRSAPDDAPPYYDRIMSGIHAAVTAHYEVTRG